MARLRRSLAPLLLGLGALLPAALLGPACTSKAPDTEVPAPKAPALDSQASETRAPEARAPEARAPEARASESAVSDVLKAPRPAGGEYLGVYMAGKKLGWSFTHVEPVPGHPEQARSINELVFKAQVGTNLIERRHREERTYEAKPGGRLLSLVVEQEGDGGNQRLEGTATAKGLKVVRKRPGLPDEVLELPPSTERVEDADPARVALYRKATVEGRTLDGTDLREYAVTTTLEPSEELLLAGVKVRVGRAVTLSQKEKAPATALIAEDGRMLSIGFGQAMEARAEPEAVAKRLDQVEIFGLTRILLPKALPSAVRQVPARLSLVVEGLPARFLRDTYRQKYQPLEAGRVRVTLSAQEPRPESLRPRPLKDPAGGDNLSSTIIIESNAPAIRDLAKQIVGDEKDAWQAAQRINAWVNKNLEKTYGSSADRATDVLRQRKGDCTEHSLLAVALLRASGIPARRVDGVVYLLNPDGVPALYWHEWVEAWVGEWTQMDPTFGQPVADATHFGLGSDGSAEVTPLLGSLEVVEVE